MKLYNENTRRMLTHLDLFSGIGGFALAASWAGFKTVGFSEIDPFCGKVLYKHWPNIPNYGDIRNVPVIPNLDLITGGFPCQPFSSAGKRKGRDDDRYLWPEFLRVINECKSAWLVIENVGGIVKMELDNIIIDLENATYTTRQFIIPACAALAPHRRDRLWLVANRNRERRDDRINNREKRYLQTDYDRDMETIQSEWSQFIPKSWKTFNAQDWLTNSDSIASQQTDTTPKPFENQQDPRLRSTRSNRTDTTGSNRPENKPPIPRVDDGLPNRVDRNKSLGNAIVPQVVYPILKVISLIRSYENEPC